MSIGQVKIDGVTTFPKITPIVQTKHAWASSWETNTLIVPQSLDTFAAPAKDKATFRYSYGRIKWQEDSSAQNYYPLALLGKYARVVVKAGSLEQQVWVGVIVSDGLDMHGNAKGDSGNQVIEAMGLEHLLDQMPVIGAVVKADDLAGGTGDRIENMPTFNTSGSCGNDVTGNRTTTADATYGVHLFSADGATWTNLDILQYLLAFYQPSDFTVTLSGQYDLLANIELVQKLEGRTLKSCIDQLIDRHRGLGWTLRIVGTVINLHIFSTFGQSIVVGNGTTLPPNREQFYLTLNSEIDMKQVIVKNVESQAFDAVNVLGAPVEVTSTFSNADGSLGAGWTAERWAEYLAGTGSSDTSDAALNDATRKGDRYANVYQRLVVPSDWNGMGHGVDIGTCVIAYSALPHYENGVLYPALVSPLFLKATRFLRYIPIAKSDGGEFSEPMAFITYDGELFQTDAPPEDVPAASLRMLDDKLGVTIKTSVPHVYGKGTFDIGTEAASNTDPLVDYEDIMITASFKTDQRLSVWHRMRAGDRTLLIRVPDAKLQYIVPQTVTGVSGGEAVLHTGGIVRDDTERLQLIAALAAAWYGQPRSAVTLKLANAFKVGDIGQYITSVSSGSSRQSIGTVITRQSWSFQKQTVSLTVNTSFYELDLSRIVEFPTIGGPRNLAGEIKTLQGDVLDIKQRTSNLTDRPAAGGGLTITTGGDGESNYTGWVAP